MRFCASHLLPGGMLALLLPLPLLRAQTAAPATALPSPPAVPLPGLTLPTGGPALPAASPLLPTPSLAAPAGPAAAPPPTPKPRKLQVPLTLQRRPMRGFLPSDDYQPPSFRVPEDSPVEVAVGLQVEARYSDNVNSAPPNFKVEDMILDTTPIVVINLGDPPGRRPPGSLQSEFYAELQYLPTVHQLLDLGTTDYLHHVVAEIGRADALSRLAVQVEYDENLFASAGDQSPEDSYTLFSAAPTFEYSLTPKTLLALKGAYGRVTTEDGSSDRTSYVGNLWGEWAATPKTALGLGAVFGHIVFDEQEFGTQTYEQAYVSTSWQATQQFMLAARLGVEFRQFDRTPSLDDRVTAVATAAANWRPGPKTQVNLGLRLQNEPSVTVDGATYREMRLGADLLQELTQTLYLRLEAEGIERDYDTGQLDHQKTVRAAMGFRAEPFGHVHAFNVELFYQFRDQDSTLEKDTYRRNQVGLQTTFYF